MPPIYHFNFNTMKVLFLDLDGTIRETKSGAKFISDPLDQKPIGGAVQKVREYFEKGWLIIGITNQMGVLKGYKTLQNMVDEQWETMKTFPEIHKIYACPDEGKTMICVYCDIYYRIIDNESESVEMIEKTLNFRKPETGMIDYFIETHDPITQALMVGDMESDELCALKADIPFMWASDWLKSEIK